MPTQMVAVTVPELPLLPCRSGMKGSSCISPDRIEVICRQSTFERAMTRQTVSDNLKSSAFHYALAPLAPPFAPAETMREHAHAGFSPSIAHRDVFIQRRSPTR